MPSRALKSRVAKSNCIKGNPICGFFLGVTGFRKDDCLLTLCLLTLHMIIHNVLDKFYSQIGLGVLEFWKIFHLSNSNSKIRFPRLRCSLGSLFILVFFILMILESFLELPECFNYSKVFLRIPIIISIITLCRRYYLIWKKRNVCLRWKFS